MDERPARWLRWLLRVLAVGVSLRLGLPWVPRAWLEHLIPFFGLGPYPDGRAMDYVLRTTCVIYFLGGWFCWSASRDLRRHKHWIRFLGWATSLFGVMVAGADWAMGAAARWQSFTGLGTVVLGLVMVRLERSLAPECLAGDGPEGRGFTGSGVWNGAGRAGPERWLRLGLRGVGAAATVGVVGVVVPQSVLAWGLTLVEPTASPATPLAPVLVFLLRSLFGACFLGGVFFWMVARHLPHDLAVARFLGWASLCFGVIIALTDLGTGLPWWLRLVAPLAGAVGVAVLWLARRCDSADGGDET